MSTINMVTLQTRTFPESAEDTIRDQYAAAAMQSLIAMSELPLDPAELADEAFAIANAMMERRYRR